MDIRSKILAVDDNPTNLIIIEELVEDRYDLYTAISGEDALREADRLRPDLILLDIMMPGIDGYETCRRLRQNPAVSHAKIIMVSAKAMVSERLAGYEAGADDYITKPFDHAEFLAKIQVYVRLKTLEEMDSLKGDLLGLLGAEIRDPVQILRAHLKRLMSDEEMDTKARRQLATTMHDQAGRLHRLLENVVTLNALRAKSKKIEGQPVDLVSVIRDVSDQIRGTPEFGCPDIVYDGEEVALLEGDPEELEATFRTLMEALLRLAQPEARLTVRVAGFGGVFNTTLCCQGVRLTGEELGTFFEPFAVTSLKGPPATDLGLAVAKEVVTAHGGSLQATNHSTRETTFLVTLPEGQREAIADGALSSAEIASPSYGR
jgi:two-component system sensor histidine kinase/response regulator